ncbi:hypothetical protein QJS10_CPB18g00849 [Acorus calamus]|uniref:Uncharacterized protein n=1 Tax=Acorus calamus TaxID=4465 RepID=A0AAV9CLJ4_ACOCL|nr:hypothetical protein QJS10_CPB18g00849 [Acorus calamus]
MSRPLIDPPHGRESHKALLRGPLKAPKEEVQRGERGRIARDYVITKNTTQVTSHSQKHFLHQSLKNAGKQCKGSQSIVNTCPRSYSVLDAHWSDQAFGHPR